LTGKHGKQDCQQYCIDALNLKLECGYFNPNLLLVNNLSGLDQVLAGKLYLERLVPSTGEQAAGKIEVSGRKRRNPEINQNRAK
jgi:hypothetical protein